MGCLKRWVWPFFLVPLVSLPFLGLFSIAQAEPPPTIPGASYIGSAECKICHPVQYDKWSQTLMGKVFLKNARNDLEKQACEACHGPGSLHKANPADPKNNIRFASKRAVQSVMEQNAVCLQCHEKGGRLYWKGSTHEMRNLACTNCHKVMESLSEQAQLAVPKNGLAARTSGKEFLQKVQVADVCTQCHQLRKAQLLRSNHMPYREGKMTCTDCHNPHGTATPKLLVANSTNEVCYKCHAERRGPFLWDHPPVREDCFNCHDSHGSNFVKLLRVPPPRLCQQCHVATFHPSAPKFMFTLVGRGCVQCHSQIHGSNHPSGARFQR